MTNDQTLPMGGDFGGSLGQYALLSLLGEGAFGQVWQARDAAGRIVALKVLRPEVAGDADAGRRFEREAKLGMKLAHPNVVRVFDAGRIDGRLYLATEFLTGGSVAGLITPAGLPVARALAIAADLMRGLQALADLGLIHRDVKPANLLLDDAGIAKVSDFGLARSTSVDRTRFTADGAIVGSPAYIAPEQISGECEPDIRCDLYAGGVLIFELLTGRTPFGNGTVLEILARHLDAKPPRLRSLRPDTPAALDELVDELLRKSPAKRPARPLEVMARLERLGAPARATPAHAPGAGAAFPATITEGARLSSPAGAVFPATILGGAFPATLPAANAFPATIPAGGAFPSTIPDGGSFPGTIPDDAPPRPAVGPRRAQATPAATISGAATLPPAAPSEPPLELTAIGAPGLARATLAFAGPGGTRWLFVYAGDRLTMGRDGIEREGQDVCLRCFPARALAESSKRISGRHLTVEVIGQRAIVTDVGSASGTFLLGERIPPRIPQPFSDGAELRVADVIDLRLGLIAPARRLRLSGLGETTDGPTVHVQRTANGPEHAYLLVTGSVFLARDGAPAADGPIQLLSVGGGLWWRAAGAASASALTAGTVLDFGGAVTTAAAIAPADQKG